MNDLIASRGLNRSWRAVPIAALIFALVAAWLTWLEATPFTRGSANAETSYARLIDGDVGWGLSTYSKELVLGDCYRGMTSVHGRVQPTARKAAFLEACSAIAERFASSAPSFSYAWLVAAAAKVGLGNEAEANEHFLMAEGTAPNEFWLAHLRLVLFIRNIAAFSEHSRAAFERDIQVHLGTDTGTRRLVSTMFAMPDLKPHVVRVAERLPENVQWRLISTLDDVGEAVQ